MAGSEWENFGDEIRRTVQDAIENQDFRKLNQNITDTVDRAMGTAFHSVSNGMKNARNGQYTQPGGNGERSRQHSFRINGQSGGSQYGPQNQFSSQGQYGNQNQYGNQRWNGHQGQYGSQNGYSQQNSYNYGSPARNVPNGSAVYKRERPAKKQMPNLPALYKKSSGTKVKGVLFGIAGGWMGIPCGLYAMGMLLASFLSAGGLNSQYLLVSIVYGAFAAAGLGLMKYGIGLCGLQNRFQRLVQGIGYREYCDVKELATMINRTEARTVKDLQKMSLKGWFRQPHFDASKKCFMTSDRMYQEYMRLEGQRKEEAARLEEKRREEVKRAEDMDSRLSPEARRVIEAGDAFIEKIHACNDAISGAEISAKISHMEILVDGIFDRVEQNPETISDVRKLMDYYLPTTIKLLEAYQDLDAQPVEGENIRVSKREIEDTLDTLNHAFEKILDDLFHRTAWDVSSDISVLNTMLAREGLKDDGINLS